MALLVAGLVGLGVAFWGLERDVGFIAQPFYAWAWWSYILVLDGVVALRRGNSLLTRRRGILLPVLVWSVTFWMIFELLNLRFQNWYYVGVFERGEGADLLKGALFGVLCYTTVFTGLFETHDLLGSFGVGSGFATRPRELPEWLPGALQGLGLLMVATAVLFSYYLAPLVWGSVTFLLDPWNYRRGARSLLADFEAGRLGPLVRLLVAGLLCGLVWESFNYFAPQKWIYTVRGLEDLKLFEMPLAGFLGFPALALDAFSFFALVSFSLQGNRTWEDPNDVSQKLRSRPSLSPWGFAATLPLHALFWAGTGLLIEEVNVGSVELELEHLASLPPEAVPRLRERGIERPRQLLRALENADRRRELQRTLSLSPADVESLADETALLDFKGIGYHHGTLLKRLGIDGLDKLARQEPDVLFEQLQRERGDATFPALRPEMVRVWVRSARERSRPLVSEAE